MSHILKICIKIVQILFENPLIFLGKWNTLFGSILLFQNV